MARASGPQRVLVLAVLAAAAIGLLSWVVQDRILYHPYEEQPPVPRHLEAFTTEHSVRTADGERLRAWWLRGTGEGPFVLAFGGNASRLDRQARSLSHLLPLVSGLVVFEYRGYGVSTGSPSEDGLYADGQALYAWLQEQGVRPEHLVLWGRSLGGAVAVELAIQRKVGGLVLQSAFTSAARVGSDNFGLPEFLVDFLCRPEYDSGAKLSASPPDFPVLLFHGFHDEIVPVQHGRELAAALAGRAQLHLHGAGHEGWGPELPEEQLHAVLGEFFAAVEGRRSWPD